MNKLVQFRSDGPGVWRIYAVGAAVCLSLSAGGYLLGIRPALAAHDRSEANRAELDAQRQKAADLALILSATQRALTTTESQVADLSVRLQPTSTLNDRLARLADAAAAAGLTVQEMQPGAATAPGRDAIYLSLPIRMSGTGTYPASAAFLHALHESFPDTSVQTLECANASNGRDASARTFRFDLAWHAANDAR